MAVSYTIGKAVGYLELDISNFKNGLKTALNEMQNTDSTMSQKFNSMGDSMVSTGKKMTIGVTTPIVAAGAAAAKTAGDFQSSMSTVQATMGITEDATSKLNGKLVNTKDALGELAQKMGKETVFSATEAADAINIMAMAGKNTQEIYDMLPNVLNMASAGEIEIAQAADIATGIMAGFNMESSRTQEVVDKVSKMASSAKGTVASFGEGLATVAGQAKSTGQSFDDVAVALEILGNHNVSAAEGGNALNRTLSNLYQPIDTAAEALQQLGVSAYDAEGNARRLPDVLHDINEKTKTMTSEERNNILGKVFDEATLKTIPFLLSDVDAAFDTTDDSVTSLYEGLQQAGSDFDGIGAAAGQAKTKLNNFQGKMTLFNSALEGLGISFGNVILPFITKFIEGLTNVINWLSNLPGPVQTVIVVLAGLVAAVGPVLIVIGKMSQGIGGVLTYGPKILSVVKTVGSSLKVLLSILAANPIVLIIAAIAALVAAFIYLWNNCEEFRNFWINLWDSIKKIAKDVADWFVDACNSIVETAKAIWNGLGEFFTCLWEGIKLVAETIWNGIVDFFTTIWEFIETLATAYFTALFNFYSTIFNGIKDVILNVWNAIKTFLENLWNGLMNTAESVWNAVSSFFTGLWNGIKNTVESIWNGIENTVVGVWDTMKSKAESIFDGIKNKVESVFNGIKSFLSPIVNWLEGIFDFDWNLPKIKLPHFSISGEFSLNPPSIPHFGVDWYKKAMSNGMIMNEPTIFGFDAKTGKFLAGGEAGSETIVGTANLLSMIKQAVEAAIGNLESMIKNYCAAVVDVFRFAISRVDSLFEPGDENNQGGQKGGDAYTLLLKIYDFLAEGVAKPEVNIEMQDGDVIMDGERVGRKLAPVISRVITK